MLVIPMQHDLFSKQYSNRFSLLEPVPEEDTLSEVAYPWNFPIGSCRAQYGKSMKWETKRDWKKRLRGNRLTSEAAYAPRCKKSMTGDHFLSGPYAAQAAERDIASNKQKPDAPIIKPGNADFIRLRYSEENGGAGETINLIVGVEALIPAQVDIAAEKREALEKHIKFAVEPPLPDGLMLDSCSGLISGTPTTAKMQTSIHHVTISISAMDKGGNPLGSLPLTKCSINVEIVKENV